MKFKNISIGTVTWMFSTPEAKRQLIRIEDNQWCWYLLDEHREVWSDYDPESTWSLDHWPLDETARVEQLLNKYDAIQD